MLHFLEMGDTEQELDVLLICKKVGEKKNQNPTRHMPSRSLCSCLRHKSLPISPELVSAKHIALWNALHISIRDSLSLLYPTDTPLSYREIHSYLQVLPVIYMNILPCLWVYSSLLSISDVYKLLQKQREKVTEWYQTLERSAALLTHSSGDYQHSAGHNPTYSKLNTF